LIKALSNLWLKKLRRDISWTFLIILILTAGLTSWILIPSTSASLRNAIRSYAENISTFIVVQQSQYPLGLTGNPDLAGFVPMIESSAGVESVNPITLNYTFIRMMLQLAIGGQVKLANVTAAFLSAVTGGNNAFPTRLVSLTSGHFPQDDDSSFVLNDNRLVIPTDKTLQVEIGSKDFNGTQGVKFNATVAGVTALNPLTAEASLLWNSTYLEQRLGSQLYNSTFGGYPNFLIIKSDTISDVQGIVDHVRQILGQNSGYTVTYDQTTLIALQSLESQSEPLFALEQYLSIAIAATIVFLVSYLAGSHRKWEPGLLLTQGWNWNRYSRLMLNYYSAMAMVSSAFGVGIAFIIARYLPYQYNLSGNALKISVSLDPILTATAFPIGLAVCTTASILSIWRLKRLGLDRILREY